MAAFDLVTLPAIYETILPCKTVITSHKSPIHENICFGNFLRIFPEFLDEPRVEKLGTPSVHHTAVSSDS